MCYNIVQIQCLLSPLTTFNIPISPRFVCTLLYFNAKRFSKCKFVCHKVRLQSIDMVCWRDVVKVGYDEQYSNLLARDPRTCCESCEHWRGEMREDPGPRIESGWARDRQRRIIKPTWTLARPRPRPRPHQTRWQRPHLDQSPHLQVHLLPSQ